MNFQIQVIKKRGRPPKSVERYPCGKSRGESVESIIATALLPRLKTGITYEESIVRDLRTGKVVGSNQDAGHVLGRLKMMGLPTGISSSQFDAGWEYADVVAEYRSLKGIPPENAKAMDYNGIGGASLKEPPEPAKVERAERRYNACTEALSRAGFETHQGNRIAKIVNAVCMDRIDFLAIRDDEVAIGNLRAGLNALGRVFR